MARWTLCVAFAAVMALTASAQDDKKGKKKQPKNRPPIGRWVREADGFRVMHNIRFRTAVTQIVKDGEKITVTSDIGYTKDNILFGRISKVKPAGVPNGPSPGVLFSFKCVRKENKLTISDFTGPDSEEAAAILEGEYTLQPAKKKEKKKKD